MGPRIWYVKDCCPRGKYVAAPALVVQKSHTVAPTKSPTDKPTVTPSNTPTKSPMDVPNKSPTVAPNKAHDGAADDNADDAHKATDDAHGKHGWMNTCYESGSNVR